LLGTHDNGLGKHVRLHLFLLEDLLTLSKLVTHLVNLVHHFLLLVVEVCDSVLDFAFKFFDCRKLVPCLVNLCSLFQYGA
jgi:uncharacterized membrane protein